MSLQASSMMRLQKSETGEVTLSAYSGELTQPALVESVARVKATFPQLPPEFFKILIERVKDKGFSDKRLIDAVNHVIDTCQYPNPTMANFLSFDKRIKVYSYNDVCNIVTRHEGAFADFHRYIEGERVFFVKKADKHAYGLPDELF